MGAEFGGDCPFPSYQVLKPFLFLLSRAPVVSLGHREASGRLLSMVKIKTSVLKQKRRPRQKSQVARQSAAQTHSSPLHRLSLTKGPGHKEIWGEGHQSASTKRAKAQPLTSCADILAQRHWGENRVSYSHSWNGLWTGDPSPLSTQLQPSPLKIY